MSEKTKESVYFSIADKINSAEDATKYQIDTYGDKIIIEVPIEDININRQIRSRFDQSKIEELAKNISENGLLHPVTIMKNNDGGYDLIIGENRLRAFQLMKRNKIPAIIKNKIEDPTQVKILQLSENLQRKDLNAIETADALMEVKENRKMTLKDLAKLLGKSESLLKNYSRIYNLPTDTKKLHLDKGTSFHKLRGLLKNTTPSESTPGALSAPEQLSLFTKSKSFLSLRPIKINIKKEPKEHLQRKIEQCRLFIKEANNILKGM